MSLTAINICTFATGDAYENGNGAAFVGAASAVQAHGGASGWSMRCNPTGVNVAYAVMEAVGTNGKVAVAAIPNDGTVSYFRAYYYFVSVTESLNLFSISGSGLGTDRIGLAIGSDLTLQLQSVIGGETGTGPGFTFSLNTRYRIEGSYNGNTGAFVFKVGIGDAAAITAFSGTSKANGNQIDAIRLGIDAFTVGSGGDYYVSDFAWCLGGFIGAGTQALLLPDGNGTDTGWILVGTVGEDKWNAIGEVPPDGDTSYIRTVSSDVYTATVADLVGASSINFVKPMMVCRGVASSPALSVRIRSGGTASDNSTGNPGSSYATGLLARVLSTDPTDSNPWTPAKVNALEVGPSSTTNVASRCTFAGILVDYVPSSFLPRLPLLGVG